MQTEYVGPPGPTVEEYSTNNIIANGWGEGSSPESSDSDEDTPHLLLLQTTVADEMVRTEFHPSIFELVMISILAALAFLGVNLRMGAHSIAEGIIPFINQNRYRVMAFVILGICIGGGEAITAYDCAHPRLSESSSMLAVKH